MKRITGFLFWLAPFSVVITLVVMVTIAACGTTSPTPAQVGQGATFLCTAAARSLQDLAVARKAGKLSASQIQNVHDAEALIDPICTAATPPVDAAAAATDLAMGLMDLASLQAGAK